MISIHHEFLENKQVKAMYITSQNFFKTPLGPESLNTWWIWDSLRNKSNDHTELKS